RAVWIIFPARPAYRQSAAARIDPNRIAEQPLADACDDSGAGAGAAGERLAGTALPDAKADVSARDDLQVPRVHAQREPGVALDQRSFCRDRRRIDVGDRL